MAADQHYEVIVAKPAFERYHKTVLPYLKTFFSPKRANEIQNSISSKLGSLKDMPTRGSKEPHLANLPKDYRFILHKESRYFCLKIIYFVLETELKVVVTDFFPTSMDSKKKTPKIE